VVNCDLIVISSASLSLSTSVMIKKPTSEMKAPIR
jgi:hypothetical protein